MLLTPELSLQSLQSVLNTQNYSQMKFTQQTLIISVRWHSGSRPAIGKILIFCVFEHLSASDRVIFLCVALSVE